MWLELLCLRVSDKVWQVSFVSLFDFLVVTLQTVGNEFLGEKLNS